MLRRTRHDDQAITYDETRPHELGFADLSGLSARSVSDGRIDLRTLERAGDAMVCECGRRYPIVDGVPIVLRDAAATSSAESRRCRARPAARGRALSSRRARRRAATARLVEHLSIYIDAHWGDRAEPPPTVRQRLRAALARSPSGAPAVGSRSSSAAASARFVAEHRGAARVVGRRPPPRRAAPRAPAARRRARRVPAARDRPALRGRARRAPASRGPGDAHAGVRRRARSAARRPACSTGSSRSTCSTRWRARASCSA